jgi:zinc and cadmium transporter
MLLKDEVLEKVSLYLTYLAGGTLLGAAFLGLIPEALTMQTAAHVLPMILIGILFFFLLEKMILWHTCRNKNCERQIHAAAPMILIGDAFHNAIDGIVITASFLSSPSMGVFVTLSTMLHEIPQELGDFGILLNSGMPKKKALGYNILSGCSAILLGVLAYFFLKELQSIIPYVLAFSAASFLYISLAELIPEMHKKTTFKESVSQILLIVAGILLIFFLKD